MRKIFLTHLLLIFMFMGTSCLLLTACSQRSKESRYQEECRAMAEVVAQWMGREIVLDPSVGYLTYNGDSLNISAPRDKFRILRYVDNSGCSACKLHLSRYSDLLQELSDSAKTSVGFLCIVNPQDIDALNLILKRDNLAQLPILVDINDELDSLNHFPTVPNMQTFLVDKHNKVLAVGDPAINPRIKELYLQILRDGEVNNARLPQTQIRAEGGEEVQLGRVSVGDTVVRSLQIRNVGSNDFVAEQVSPSCDCTTAELSTSTIHPGEIAILTISFSESEPLGDFYRTIDIFGNTPEPLTVEIFGTLTK
jgi:hypothetical protein